MSFRSVGGAVAVVVLIAGLTPGLATAQQQRGSRLPRGLFGGGVGAAEQLLTLDLSAGAGVSSAVLTAPGVTDAGSSFGHLGGGVQYTLVRQRVGLWAGASSSAQYYSGAPGQFPARHVASAGGSFDIPLSARNNLVLGQSVTYLPVQTVSPFPGLADPGLGAGQSLPIDPNLATSGDGFMSYTSTVSLGRQLSRRTSVSLDAGYTGAGLLSDTGKVSTVRGGGRLTHELARGLGARVGYGYTKGTYSDPAAAQTARFDHQNIDVGVDYSRALSLTRRTTLSFSTGSTILTDGVDSRFDLNGHARLNHTLGRSWQGAVAYRRGAEFVGTLRAPVVADSVAAGLDGLIGQRLQVSAATGAARGNVGLTAGNGFRSSYVTAGLTVSMTQYIGLDLNYSYYRSDFDTASALAPGVPDHFDRQSLVASVRLWAPLIARARRFNAAR